MNNNQGFVLLDALICVLICSVLVMSVTTIYQKHFEIEDCIHQEMERMDEKWEEEQGSF